MDNARIKTLDQELGVLKKAVDRMYQLTSVERLNYSLIESQFDQLKQRNQRIMEENDVALAKVAEALTSADQIIVKAKMEEADIKSSAIVLLSKAQARYKEIEKVLNAADKKLVKDHLKGLEAEVA